jgi:CRISPR-associated exonuclease Cas4
VLALALFLILMALLLFRQSWRQVKSAGLPGGRIIYTDMRTWGKLERPLYDPGLGLTGKPDYLVRQKGRLIPVEVKTGRTPATPHAAHIFQLAAYCLLIERVYGQRPTHGILHYPERDFAVDYTRELESALLDVLAAMRQPEKQHPVPRSHADPKRCVRCGFRDSCDQKL